MYINLHLLQWYDVFSNYNRIVELFGKKAGLKYLRECSKGGDL